MSLNGALVVCSTYHGLQSCNIFMNLHKTSLQEICPVALGDIPLTTIHRPLYKKHLYINTINLNSQSSKSSKMKRINHTDFNSSS